MSAVIGDKAIRLPTSTGPLADGEREKGNTMFRHNGTSGKGEFSTDGTVWTPFGTGTGGWPTAKPANPVEGSFFYHSDKKLKVYIGSQWMTSADAFAADSTLNTGGGGGQQPDPDPDPPSLLTLTSINNSLNISGLQIPDSPRNRYIGLDLGFYITQNLAGSFNNPLRDASGAVVTAPINYLTVGDIRIYGIRYLNRPGHGTDGRLRFFYAKPSTGSKTFNVKFTRSSDATKTHTVNNIIFDQQTTVTIPNGGSDPGDNDGTASQFFKDVQIPAGNRAIMTEIFGGGPNPAFSVLNLVNFTMTEVAAGN